MKLAPILLIVLLSACNHKQQPIKPVVLRIPAKCISWLEVDRTRCFDIDGIHARCNDMIIEYNCIKVKH